MNQYTGIVTPGVASVNGLANATNVVTVNGAATVRQGEYWWKETGVNNASAPVWASLNVAASNGGTTNTTVNRYVPKATENPTHDEDGNQTGDGRWQYRWDAENRLVEMETTTAATTAGAPYAKVRWTYDPLGRRIRRESWQATNAVVVTRYVYDGWQCLAELDGSNAVTATYAWGIDLSGSRTGAGGVGGLLWVTHTQHGHHFYAYDGNGNVCGLTSAADGTRVGGYEYDPFGRVIRANEAHPVAGWNEWQHSTKRKVQNANLLGYELRIFDAAIGRWLSRDPLEEDGGIAIRAFVRNAAVCSIDPLGLSEIERSAERVGIGNFADSSNILLQTRQDRKWYKDPIYAEFKSRSSRCHTCGRPLAPFAGRLDHIPALKLGPSLVTARQCDDCSNSTGGIISGITKRGAPAIRVARATAIVGLGSVSLLGAGTGMIDSMRESDSKRVAGAAIDSYDAAIQACKAKAWESELESCSCCVVVGTHQFRYAAREVNPLVARVRRAFGIAVVNDGPSGDIIRASFRGVLQEGGCGAYRSPGYLMPSDSVVTEDLLPM